MKKLILLFFICWPAIVDAAAIPMLFRTKDPTLAAAVDAVWCIEIVCIIFFKVGNKLENDKLKDEKDEQEKLNQNRVSFSKKTKPVNEKFKKYEIYTSKNFKKKK